MEVSTHGDRTLTGLDHARLARLVRCGGEQGAPPPGGRIDAMLDVAHRVPSRDVAADGVTLSSHVELADHATPHACRLESGDVS